MDEFHGIFAVLLCQDSSQRGWVEGGRWQKPLVRTPFGAAMMPVGVHTMTHAILVGHRDVQSAVGAILDPHHLISALHWCHYFSRDFGGSAKCPPGKQAS